MTERPEIREAIASGKLRVKRGRGLRAVNGLWKIVRKNIGQATSRQREALYLYVKHGLTLAECGAHMRITRQGVDGLLRRFFSRVGLL